MWSRRLALALLLVSPTALLAQQRIITGHITSALTKDSLNGASVAVLGTAVAAVTNEKGAFSLFAPDGTVTLLVRMIGFKRQQVTVAGDQSVADVVLEPDVFHLDAIVVTGLVTGVEQKNLANAVSTVASDELSRAPAQTIESALQGKVPGALIQMNSGAPGGGGQINLRGVTTINAGVDPLIVVDGMVVSNDALASNMNAVTAAGAGGNASSQDNPVNRIADLNPADIDHVEILKGASAAAIYGSQAANGVIIITTKRGQSGKTRYSMTQRFGQSRVSNHLGSRVFADSAEAVGVFGHAAIVGPLCHGGCPDFNNEGVLFGDHPVTTETDASVSGGTGSTNYFLSGLVQQQGGIAPNTGYGKQSIRANLDQFLGSNLRLSLNTNLVHSVADRGISNNDNTGTSTFLVLPNTPSFFNLQPTNGVFPVNPFAPSNPLQTFALLQNGEGVWRVFGAGSINYDVLSTATQHLSATVQGGVDYFNQQDNILSPPTLQYEPNDGLPGTLVLGKAAEHVLTFSGGLSHKYTPASGGFSATTSAGFQYEDRNLDQTSVVGRDFLSGVTDVQQATSVVLTQFLQPTRNFSLYGQEEVLTMQERLLLTAGLRADRSSVNGNPDKYYLFPKASASYRFLSPMHGVDEVKIRGAWGQTGNLPTFGVKFTPDTTGTLGGLFGTLVTPQAGDPSIRPETNTEIEAGVDATLSNQLATIGITVYQKQITNLILTQTLAPSTGQGTRVFNGGELRNHGLELSLELSPVRTPTMSWLMRTSFFTNNSLVENLPVPAFQVGGFGTALGAFQIEQGKSATQIVGLDSTGKVVVVGDANPKFQMSFSSDLTWKRWSLGFLWDWKQGGDIINLTQLLYDASQNSADWNTGGSQRFASFVNGNTQPYVQDGSYLKLREVSLGYTVPADIASHLFGSGVQDVRLSLTGRNLLTFTPYKGLDPEVSNFGNQAIARNIDVAPFPPSRTFTFS
ncbi:MAG TPA: SusC/RagA family TonB-linked outer membrane protein, partial [Gemmatimonadales bacterium]|nr:SusC/RagA family TonB-linked outer membrane protein [Gemmatimonadales bacterium]